MLVPELPIVKVPSIVSSPVADTKSVESDSAAVPNPKLFLADKAEDAPVPPLRIDKSVPFQSSLLIVSWVARSPRVAESAFKSSLVSF